MCMQKITHLSWSIWYFACIHTHILIWIPVSYLHVRYIYIYNLYYSILYYIILYYIILYGLGVFSRPGETLFLPIILGLSSSLDASSPYMLMHVMFWYCDMYIYIYIDIIYICTPSGVINRGLLEKDFPRYESPCLMQFPNIFQLATGDTDVYSKLFNHYKQTPTA